MPRMLRRLLPTLLAAFLLTSCQFLGEPELSLPPQVRIHWLHGFYTMDSDTQLDYAKEMDAISLGWARLEYMDGELLVNSGWGHDNDWIRPENADETLTALASRSVPCNLNIYGTSSTFRALAEAGSLKDAADAFVAAAHPYAGLTVDIEGLRTASRSDFSDFMALLRSALPADKLLYVCVPPDTWYGGYDFRVLGDLCDRVILMAHDYQWTSIPQEKVGQTDTYSPLSPLPQVETALQHVTDLETGVRDVSKVALQIAFNSCGLHVDENGAILDTTLYHPATNTIAKRLAQTDSVREWDEASGNPSLWYYTEDGSRYRLWYEDVQSIQAKLELCAKYGVTGVSIWRLGSIPSYPNIAHYDTWALLTGPSLRS